MSEGAAAAPDDEPVLRARLRAIVRADTSLMACLAAVRTLRLEAWCIGAGAVRNRVWDAVLGPAADGGHAGGGRGSTGAPASADAPDVDVAYVDRLPWAASRDASLARQLSALRPGVPWEVVHQAHVPGGQALLASSPVPPSAPHRDAAQALESALATWPETATAVGVTLREDGDLAVVAPFGLADLFAGVLRPNPACADAVAFGERLARKRWRARWPALRLAEAHAPT